MNDRDFAKKLSKYCIERFAARGRREAGIDRTQPTETQQLKQAIALVREASIKHFDNKLTRNDMSGLLNTLEQRACV